MTLWFRPIGISYIYEIRTKGFEDKTTGRFEMTLGATDGRRMRGIERAVDIERKSADRPRHKDLLWWGWGSCMSVTLLRLHLAWTSDGTHTTKTPPRRRIRTSRRLNSNLQLLTGYAPSCRFHHAPVAAVRLQTT